MDSPSTSSFEAFRRVTSEYYREPDPRLAVLALQHTLGLLATIEPAQLQRFGNVVYLFRRIAEVSDDARIGFEPLLRGYRGPHRELALAILEAPDGGRAPSALDLAVQGPEHLDLLWAEFFVTGSPEPILRIIGTLDLGDQVRRHLEIWLRARSFFGGAARRATASTLREVGLEVDLDSRAIVTEADLDCLCFSIAERKFPIFKHLPFALPSADLLVLATKGAALWSLRLNSTVHALVAELCRAERARPGGAARLRLTEPVEGKPFAL
jgi:hypothetical protein